ncbi:septation regulator SpoVG [Anaerobranca gottschalkii]|uniref:Putative septation protein SpoVG n=1 Tax=Anaerobranca gottschalkii DSM 13577 TaxID=1120990 RepID=A0A1I0BYT3_9FIRM|nr:septation regulator SpoVG [Anaerobranca gottschalkii]SET12233.1 stage V sporulation protein G [Anaerobranca gottschalkii DSM 13577]
MQITDVRVRRVNKDGKMRAIVSVTFDNEFVVHDIRVVEGANGFFVAMPSRKGSDGEHRDIAHPITSNVRSMIQEAVLKAYHSFVENQPQQN